MLDEIKTKQKKKVAICLGIKQKLVQNMGVNQRQRRETTEGNLMNDEDQSHIPGASNPLTSGFPPSCALPPLPLISTRKSHYTCSLVPGAPGPSLTFPSTLGPRQKLFCRVTTPRGRCSRLPHLHSRSHRTHQAAPKETALPRVAGLELARIENAATVNSTPQSPPAHVPRSPPPPRSQPGFRPVGQAYSQARC